MPKANVDHTLNDQGTAVSTLDHSATTPRAHSGLTDGPKGMQTHQVAHSGLTEGPKEMQANQVTYSGITEGSRGMQTQWVVHLQLTEGSVN